MGADYHCRGGSGGPAGYRQTLGKVSGCAAAAPHHGGCLGSGGGRRVSRASRRRRRRRANKLSLLPVGADKPGRSE